MSTVDFTAAVELAREALPVYGIPATTELSLLKRRENTVFGLEHDGTGYVLRVHRQGYHPDDALASELEFVEALGAQGVPVPSFVRTCAGASFTHVGAEHPAGIHQVDLQVLIPNHGTFGNERTGFEGTATIEPADFRALGGLIAQVHEATERAGFAPEVQREDWDLEGLVGKNPAWGDPLRIAELSDEDRRTLEAAIERIRAILIDYGTPAHRFGAIHADLTSENVLRTDRGLVVIDFDDFALGWHLFDLATALYFFTPHPRYEEYRRALFSGYEATRPLETEDHAAFDALLLARALTYLGWAADRRGEPTAEWHATTVRHNVLRLARIFLATHP